MSRIDFTDFLNNLKTDSNKILIESLNNGFVALFESEAVDYPKAGPVVSGLEVREDIPNMESISATLSDYKVLPGVREVPMAGFNAAPKDMFYAANDVKWTKELAEKIKESREINPLIIVVDKEGPYVLEGAHRISALYLLGIKSFPAIVVLDLS